MTNDYQLHTETATDMLRLAAKNVEGNPVQYWLTAAQVHATLALAAATQAAAAPAMVQAAVQLDGVARKAEERIQEARESGIVSEPLTSRICGMDEVAGYAREQARYLRHVAGVDGEAK